MSLLIGDLVSICLSAWWFYFVTVILTFLMMVFFFCAYRDYEKPTRLFNHVLSTFPFIFTQIIGSIFFPIGYKGPFRFQIFIASFIAWIPLYTLFMLNPLACGGFDYPDVRRPFRINLILSELWYLLSKVVYSGLIYLITASALASDDMAAYYSEDTRGDITAYWSTWAVIPAVSLVLSGLIQFPVAIYHIVMKPRRVERERLEFCQRQVEQKREQKRLDRQETQRTKREQNRIKQQNG
eukprot:gnl/Dysnectes_brevis/3099_a3853_1388.p1 GENE.gnl/Dysnectes_brevis/3099_a3853_1388~~gnl/Dysnectes_brevis/3099_a3853_1388.p1  ORF type:complete len:239 (+),score=4.50 gnl/Dysnectes_brevis/3099_a3853_1388:25-741(+)